MTQVWPGLVVSPETVNKRVNLLREALGDDPREPRYIAGVRSRGYRLIAVVSPTTDAALLPNLPTPIPEGSPRAAELPVPPIPIDAHPPELPTSRSRLRRWAALSVLTAGLLIAATIGVRWAARHQVEEASSAPAAPATTTAAIGALSRTVAVLPFDSISADPADAYLAQGFPEMILNRLSRIEWAFGHRAQFLIRACHQEHRFTRDRPAPQFRISDRRQRATRGGSVAGGGAPRG